MQPAKWSRTKLKSRGESIFILGEIVGARIVRGVGGLAGWCVCALSGVCVRVPFRVVDCVVAVCGLIDGK